jgi:hypothetical protein
MELTLQEARELKTLTDQIVENLRVIAEDSPSDAELRELLATTGAIVENMKQIERGAVGLDLLEKRVADIAANLRDIKADETTQELEAES